MLRLFVDSDGKIKKFTLSKEEAKVIAESSSIADFIANLSAKKKNLLIVDRSPKPKIVHLLLQDQMDYKDIVPNAKYKALKGSVVIWQPWRYTLPQKDFDEIVLINNYFLDHKA
jgi:hypothetical protein